MCPRSNLLQRGGALICLAPDFVDIAYDLRELEIARRGGYKRLQLESGLTFTDARKAGDQVVFESGKRKGWLDDSAGGKYRYAVRRPGGVGESLTVDCRTFLAKCGAAVLYVRDPPAGEIH